MHLFEERSEILSKISYRALSSSRNVGPLEAVLVLPLPHLGVDAIVQANLLQFLRRAGQEERGREIIEMICNLLALQSVNSIHAALARYNLNIAAGPCKCFQVMFANERKPRKKNFQITFSGCGAANDEKEKNKCRETAPHFRDQLTTL